MERIEDPINDVAALRAHLKENKKFHALRGDFIYATISACTPETLAEAESGKWVHVHIFEGEDMNQIDNLGGVDNIVLFRRKAPDFYTWDNPWLEKGPLAWLPNLESKIPSKFKPLLEESAPHGGPCIARRYRCACGEKKLRILHNEEMGRVESVCTECGDRKILTDRECAQKKADNPPQPEIANQESLKTLKCKCNTKLLSPLFAIEYTPESDDGWDFSWLKVIALCRNCGHSWFISEIEV